MGRKARWHVAASSAVVAALALIVPAPVSAQIPEGAAALSVSPPTTSIDVAPGQKFTKKIGLDNISDIDRKVNVEVHNFAANGEDGEAKLTTDEGVYSLKQWIKVTPPSASIKAHAHQDFQVEITVPTNAPPGGHFGAVVFSPLAGDAADGASLSVVSQVTSLILLRVPGDAKEQADIQNFTACTEKDAAKSKCETGKSMFTGGPISLNTRIKNSGNVQVMPSGTIVVRNLFGKKVTTIPVNGANVLPESTRRFETKWPAKRMLGQYKATVNLKYGSADQPLTKTVTFWVIPIGTIIAVLAVLLVGFFLGWLPRKRWKKAFKAMASGGD